MSKQETWLELAPEFGGERLGPFEGPTIRIGSADDADLQVHQDLGVAAEHAMVLKKNDGSHILAPVDRAAAVYLLRNGESMPRMVRNPVVLRPGDRFMLGRPEGPAFDLVLAAAPRRKTTAAQDSAQDMAKRTSKAIGREVFRRGRAVLVTYGPGAWIQQTYYFLRSGQLFSPVYLIAGVMALGAGVQTCRFQSLDIDFAAAQKEADTCKTALSSTYAPSARDGLPRFDTLMGQLLQHTPWQDQLDWNNLSDTTLDEMRSLLDAEPSNRRSYLEAAGAFSRQLAGLDTPLRRTVPYLLAYPASRASDEGQWDLRADPHTDADYTTACVRGPLRMSWRQATNVGLDALFSVPVKKDDVVDLAASADSTDFWQTAIKKLAFTARDDATNIRRIRSSGAIRPERVDLGGGSTACYTVLLDGQQPTSDARLSVPMLANTVASLLGPKAARLPDKASKGYVLSRLAYWEAMATDFADADALRFGHGDLDRGFEDVESLDQPAIDFVRDQVALTLARATVLPCLQVAESEDADWPEDLGPAPDRESCVYFLAALEAGIF